MGKSRSFSILKCFDTLWGRGWILFLSLVATFSSSSQVLAEDVKRWDVGVSCFCLDLR